MSIPMYFVAKQKENVTQSGAIALPYSCGSSKNGNLRLPEHFWTGVPLLVDDAVPTLLSSAGLKRLTELCEKGCILDFERSVSQFHISLLRRLSELPLPFLWLPERYLSHAPKAVAIVSHGLPHNSWQQFCHAQQSRFKNGWALELQPMHCVKKMPYPQKSQDFYLSDAHCRGKIENDSITYYDTKKTLLKKLHIASEFGCQGGIALWSEWSALPG